MAYNVLIVDDSPGMRKVLRRVLTLSSFDAGAFYEANDGREALYMLGRERVDVVLTDVDMPNMNGEELIEQLSIDPIFSKIPVVVVSTDRSDDGLHRMLSLGAKGYVSRPFVPQTLGHQINKLIGSEPYASQ